MRFLMQFLLIFGPSVNAFASYEKNCGDFNDLKIQGNFCIHHDTDSSSKDVIFHFHGIFGHESDWEDNQRNIDIRQRWSDKGIDQPTVISLSFGRSWLVTPQAKSSFSGLYETLHYRVLPYLEKNYLAQHYGKRILLGISMGGFNAFQLYVRNPNKYFKVALICPAMATVTPFMSSKKIEKFILKNNAEPKLVKRALGLSRKHFDNVSDWLINSPLEYLERSLPIGISKTKVYISANTEDDYGFYSGDLALKNLLIQKNVDVSWDEVAGVHCVTNPKGVADFIY
jgi:pimeloyl-ACP methyl ester carboxylesterase